MCVCRGGYEEDACEGGPECLDDEGAPLYEDLIADRAVLSGPVAFCAPGKRLTAALALMLQGEQVSEIRESRVLEGVADVIVASPETFRPLEPEPLALVLDRQVAEDLRAMRARRDWRHYMAMAPVSPSPLSSFLAGV